MHGSVDIITVVMVIEKIKKIILSLLDDENNKWRKYFYIAMLALFAIIAIVFVDLMFRNSKKLEEDAKRAAIEAQNVVIGPLENEEVEKLINDYFKARTDLNYPKIFSSFGRDYYKEEREDKDGSFKKIIDSIKYERMFVEGYKDIKIYSTKGYYDGDLLCIVTYDLAFGFTSDTAPMVIIFYLEKKNGKYVIKNNLDVGTSKYIVDIVNTDVVKDLYESVYTRLNRVLVSNESLRLSYNSLRQYEMNMGSDLNSNNTVEIIDNSRIKILDPVAGANEIYDEILERKEKEREEKFLEDYLELYKASMSEVARVQ